MTDFFQTTGRVGKYPKVSQVASSVSFGMHRTEVSGLTHYPMRPASISLVSSLGEINATDKQPKSLLSIGRTERLTNQTFNGTYRRDRTTVSGDVRTIIAVLTSPDGRYILREPVILKVSDLDSDGIYVVTDDFSTSYGTGETQSEAIKSYSLNLFADFEELVEDESILGVGLQRELASLRHYISSR